MNLFAAGIDYFIKGGWVMWPLLVCSIATLAIGVERTLYFRKADSGRGFTKKFCTYIEENNWDAAKQLGLGPGLQLVLHVVAAAAVPLAAHQQPAEQAVEADQQDGLADGAAQRAALHAGQRAGEKVQRPQNGPLDARRPQLAERQPQHRHDGRGRKAGLEGLQHRSPESRFFLRLRQGCRVQGLFHVPSLFPFFPQKNSAFACILSH